MSVKRKIERETVALIEDVGLRLVDLKVGRKHMRATVRAPDGRSMIIFFSGTPSDHRAHMNKRAHLRRFAQGLEGKAG